MKNEYRQKTFFQIICPGCKQSPEDGHHSWWPDKDQAELIAEESEWQKFDGYLYCPDCLVWCECDEAQVPVGRTCPECGRVKP